MILIYKFVQVNHQNHIIQNVLKLPKHSQILNIFIADLSFNFDFSANRINVNNEIE